MDIGIINESSSTGAWRYLGLLVQNMKIVDKNCRITIYYDDLNECPYSLYEFAKGNDVILFRVFRDKKSWHRKKGIKRILVSIARSPITLLRYISYVTRDWLKKKKMSQHDVLFFPWPYQSDACNLKKPIFFVPHDLIFSHYFGHHVGNFYSIEYYEKNKSRLSQFAKSGIAIVSSEYSAKEFQSVFPDYKRNPYIVPLSGLTTNRHMSKEKIVQILEKYDIHDDYILFPTNSMHHKNIGQVLGAYYYIKEKVDIKMIIVGFGVDGVRVLCNSPYYCDHVANEEQYDIKSLGFLNDEEVFVLFKNSRLVINASLCEAACGSGLDAWSLGIPTAISCIPPYIEQVAKLGVKTAFFDPRNSMDIAHAVLELLENPGLAEENAQISQKQMEKYTWEEVARQYLEIFSQKG